MFVEEEQLSRSKCRVISCTDLHLQSIEDRDGGALTCI